MAKIKFKNAKPGMIIERVDYGQEIITAITGKLSSGKQTHLSSGTEQNWYCRYSIEDGAYGLGWTHFDPEEKVKIVRGAKREQTILYMKRDIRSEIGRLERQLNLLDLLNEI